MACHQVSQRSQYVSMQNLKNLELLGWQVTGLQYAFAGSFFSDVNEAQRCAGHDDRRQRT